MTRGDVGLHRRAPKRHVISVSLDELYLYPIMLSCVRMRQDNRCAQN